jgi:hypothetical protein
MTTSQGEAEITRPDGLKIILRGDKTFLAEAVALIEGGAGKQAIPARQAGQSGNAVPASSSVDLTSVAEVDDEQKLQLTVTDLKAANQADATERLIYVALLARRQLLNEKKTPRKELLRHLRDYGLADGNSRASIARDKALVKEGAKFIWLSSPAVSTAQKYVNEINDPKIVGTWTRARRASRKKNVSRSSATPSPEGEGG